MATETETAKVGDVKVKTFVYRYEQRECEICGEPATHQLTYLLKQARTNPHSRGYGKDDLSWCSDGERFACDQHSQQLRRAPLLSMEWCSDFPLRLRDDGTFANAHLLCYWREDAVSIGRDLPIAITEDGRLAELLYWGEFNRCLTHLDRRTHAIGADCKLVAEKLYSIERVTR